jgi:IS1 family transposase
MLPLETTRRSLCLWNGYKRIRHRGVKWHFGETYDVLQGIIQAWKDHKIRTYRLAGKEITSEISGCHGGEYEDSLLGYNAV